MQGDTHFTQVDGPTFLSEAHSIKSAVILDVRTPQEFSDGHIDGAINVDFEAPTFLSEISKLSKETPYFIYCRSGNRSGQAVAIMKKEGFLNITELQGGLVSNTTSIALVPSAQEDYVVDESDMLTQPLLPPSSETTTLSPSEVSGLIQMREEEKLAHDVYALLGAQWNMQVFTNISGSEETHTTAVKALLDQYGIKDPVGQNGEGVFTSPVLKKLYTELVAQGSRSLVDALVVGATIEDLDIRDLDVLMSGTKNADILATYSLLQKGSRNHLRGFIRNLSARGGTYAPQYISGDAYQEILSTPQERGGGR